MKEREYWGRDKQDDSLFGWTYSKEGYCENDCYMDGVDCCLEDCYLDDCFTEYYCCVGPTGPAGTQTQLKGIQLQLIDSGAEAVNHNNNIIFNRVLNNQSSNIYYDSSTGTLTFNRQGNYYLAWWVATDGANIATTITFATEVNGNIIAEGSSPVVAGQVNGSALLTVESMPSEVRIINVTGETVTYARTPVQANITILEAAV